MALVESYDFNALENEAERIVTAELERRLDEIADPAICVCQACVLDMAALALNCVRPAYRVSLLGSLYAQALNEGSYRHEVARAVEAAIDRVHSRPSHD